MSPRFLQSLAVSQRHRGVSLSVSPGGPVPSKGELWGWLLWPFCGCHSLQRLMNWLWGCCQCVCALGEGVPVTGGNPSYGIRPGATIVAVLQGALGAGGPGSSSDPHTAVTPLETQRHSPLNGPLIGSDKMTLCGVLQFRSGRPPDCAKLLLMVAVRKGQKRKTT